MQKTPPIDAPGLSEERLNELASTIQADIKVGRYFGASIAVARHGKLGLFDSFGHTDPQASSVLSKDAVFTIFSVTKAFTNALIFRCIDRGQLSLTTKVSTLIPEFAGGRRADITIYHLLTHSSGLPSLFTPKPGMYIDRLHEIIEAICANVHCEREPGESVTYAPMAAHALLGEVARRCDPKGRSYRDLIHEELFEPLGMADTAIGVRGDLKPRHIPPHFIDPIPMNHLGHSDFGEHGAFEEEDSEMPWVGAVSTVHDLFRFAEMLRAGGLIEGTQFLSPTILDRATTNQTGNKPNLLFSQLALARGWNEPIHANIGLGFSLRGEGICHHQFGTLASPRTFGNFGLGSALFWVDPSLDLTFVCLTTGVINEGDNTERFQRLSDMAIAAAV